jgi:hypothetical protein
MALKEQQLKQALIAAFEEGKTATSSATVAEAIAAAIHAYVSQAEVAGITVSVAGPAGPMAGTQTGSVKVK